ncbi:hypothetical protein [Xenorhabdus miraniensis]|uniref:Uncharacterized protein n=1 Tax=Xenorhabdus miraniensis TaxID=351674 RepID=A0A2D0JLG1_9GAMM|nr:hypothetical protein [Xenorhabdus miraniensis]PHM47133.1 hypothetical protein Xmir_03555 [Xenorhabdus miraniensis]
MDILEKRKWLNLNESARLLSNKLKHKISVSDVSRLIADEEIKPSIFFHTPVFAREIEIEDKPLSYVLSETEAAIDCNRHLLRLEPILPDVAVPHATPVDRNIIRLSGLWSAIPQGITRYEAEKIYSSEERLSPPSRSLYDLKGVIVSTPEKKFQIVNSIDAEAELLGLIKLSQSDESESGFLMGHINKLKALRQNSYEERMFDSFVPCIEFPQNSYFAIKTEDLDSFVSSWSKPEKQISSKTSNAQAQFIYGLLFTKYGAEVAENPRRHMENPRGTIRADFEKAGLPLPSGNAVMGWLKDIIP